MIPSNKAKVLDNFAVNADGTIVEVGGNVAFESIEKIGHMVDSAPVIKEVVVGSPGITVTPPSAGTYTLFKGVKETTGFLEGGPTLSISEGDMVYSSEGLYFFAKINGKIYNNAGSNFTLKGDNITKGDSYSLISGDMQLVTAPGGKVFKPFFTEAQYQALLALITNK